MHKDSFQQSLAKLDELTNFSVDLSQVSARQKVQFRELKKIFTMCVELHYVEGIMVTGAAMIQAYEAVELENNPYRQAFLDVMDVYFSYVSGLLEKFLAEFGE